MQSISVKTNVDSLNVAWEPPVDGLVEKYTVELKYVAGSRTHVTDINNRTATFFGLKSGAPYTVLVIAVSGVQNSIGVENTYYTSK